MQKKTKKNKLEKNKLREVGEHNFYQNYTS